MQTERIDFQDFTIEDLDLLVEMRSDPDVVKHIGGAKASDRNWNKGRLEFYISCYPRKIGQRKMVWRESGEAFGWSGLQPLPGTDEIEVSYGMVRKFWRKGIGFEAADMWMSYGFEDLGLKRIVAITEKENLGSRRIMEKLGMSFEKEGEFYNMKCLLYGMSRESWFNKPAI